LFVAKSRVCCNAKVFAVSPQAEIPSLLSQLYPGRELLNHEATPRRFLDDSMLILLEYIALVVLVAVSLGGFAAAVTWTFAIWFGNRG